MDDYFSTPAGIEDLIQTMTLEERPDVTYADIGGCVHQIEELRKFVEPSLINPRRFGHNSSAGAILSGPSGTGKTLCARAIANRTGACLIHVRSPQLLRRRNGVQIVSRIFRIARAKRASIIFFHNFDSLAGTMRRNDWRENRDVRRTIYAMTMQLDDLTENVMVLMGSTQPEKLDVRLLRDGRIKHRVEFTLPDAADRAQIFRIRVRDMSVRDDIRYELLAMLTPGCTGTDIQRICLEATSIQTQTNQSVVTEKNFLVAIYNVIRGYAKSIPKPRFKPENYAEEVGFVLVNLP